MQYYSTRNHAALFSLQEAAFRGLAPDGGLFMPAVIPHADLEKVRELSECSFSELSRYLTGLFLVCLLYTSDAADESRYV